MSPQEIQRDRSGGLRKAERAQKDPEIYRQLHIGSLVPPDKNAFARQRWWTHREYRVVSQSDER